MRRCVIGFTDTYRKSRAAISKRGHSNLTPVRYRSLLAARGARPVDCLLQRRMRTLFDQLLEKPYHLIRFAKNRRYATIMVNAAAISHNVTLSEFLRAWIARAKMAAIAASEKSRMLNAGRTHPGASKWIIRNADTTINTLNNVSMPIESSEGTFLFIHHALEAINLFPLT
jgi:hypothetical protein